MKKGITILLCTLFIFSSIYACGKDSNQQAREGVVEDEKWVALEKGKMAKDFTLKDLKGNAVSLSDFKGKIVFLNFWATWCAPCRHEMPDIEKLQNKYEKDIVVLAVSTDTQGEEIVRPYIEKNKFTFRVLIDSSSDVSDKYSIFALPTTFIIDRQGKIVEMIPGAREWAGEEIFTFFDDLIAEGDIA